MAAASIVRIGVELREARLDRALSIDAVAKAISVSNAQVSRIERGWSPEVSLATLARFAVVVGLDFSARLYPGPTPLRDAPQVQLLQDFRALLHRSLRWALEVPLPSPGDQRAWDALVTGEDWRIGVEAETGPRDVQALLRRLHLKERDGAVDGVILLLRDNRVTRRFLDDAQVQLEPAFPLRSRDILRALRDGRHPAGNATVVVPRRSPTR